VRDVHRSAAAPALPSSLTVIVLVASLLRRPLQDLHDGVSGELCGHDNLSHRQGHVQL
jgi:hypothetical protein